MRQIEREIYKMLLDTREDLDYCIKHTQLRLHNLEKQYDQNEIEITKFKERVKNNE